jgi:hypothetical protein
VRAANPRETRLADAYVSAMGDCMKSLIIVLALLFPTIASADSTQHFVRITCIPEARFFSFEYRAVDGNAALTDAKYDEKKRKRRLDLWKNQGYFEPSHLKYECRLQGVSYTLSTKQRKPQDRGGCGANQPIELTLLRNNKEILHNVMLGDVCIEAGAFVTSVDISEPPDGWGSKTMTICVVGSPPEGQLRTDAKPRCEFLRDEELIQTMPITTKTIERYGKGR